MATPNKYRFILGKSPDTSKNLVTNGTFTGSASGWTLGANWSYNSNEVRGTFSTTWINNIIKQTGIVYPGTTYYLSYQLRKQSGSNARVAPSIGGVYYDVVSGYDQNNSTSYATYVHENMLCSFGNDLLFDISNADPVAIDNVLLYAYVWNNPLKYEPVNWDNGKITKKRDETLNGFIVNYISDLVFIEDGYDYLYAKFLSDGYCGEIPVRIEVYNSQTTIYEKYYEGYIYISECSFNTTKREVSVNIVDSNASQVFIKSKNVKVNVFPEYYNSSNILIARNSTFPLTGPNPTAAVVVNDNAGSYTASCFESIAIIVYELLRKIVLRSTNYRLDFDSAFFSSGTFDKFLITTGVLINGAGAADLSTQQISMNDLFTELNKLFNLSFSIDNTGSIPKVFIEPKVSYLSPSPVLSISQINEMEVKIDTENVVRTINTGFHHIDSTSTGTGLDDPKGEQYSTSNLCADKDLNIVSEYIQNSVLIKSLFNGAITSNKYDKTYVWMETTGVIDFTCDVLGAYLSRNSGSGNYDLNPNIDTADNILRHIQTLQTDFLKPTILGEETIIKTNASLTNVYSFKYPISKAQFDLIQQAYNTIEFNTDGTGSTTKQGFLIEANYEIKTGLTEFKLLAS